jgi:Domain of unknown function (DUF4129)
VIDQAPAGVTRGEGQRLARDELSRVIYHPGTPVLLRAWHAIHGALTRFYGTMNRVTPGGWWAFVVLVLGVVLVIGVIGMMNGPVRRSHRRSPGLVGSGPPLSARALRERAAALAASGDFTAATVECMRAIVAGLEERAVITPDAGRTADEFAALAGQALPGHADALGRAARLFDDVWYGEQPGTPEGYEQLSALAAATQAARTGGVRAPA